jgi:hypothetical protein
VAGTLSGAVPVTAIVSLMRGARAPLRPLEATFSILALWLGVFAPVATQVSLGQPLTPATEPVTPATTHALGQPFMNVASFSGESELAVVSQGKLWVLDGANGSVAKLPVPTGQVPSSPSFSSDGRWLSFITTRQTATGMVKAVWVARSAGQDARLLATFSGSPALVIGWGPGHDVLRDIAYLLPMGWWPRWGIGYAVIQGNPGSPFDSSVRNNGLLLDTVAGPGAQSHALGNVLVDGADGPVAASSGGQLAITVNSFAEPVWQHQQAERCSPVTFSCIPLPEPAATVSMDALWSPDGSKLSLGRGDIPSFPFTGFVRPASADSWDEAWLATGDPERDAYIALDRLYALFGLVASDNPYV